MPSRPESAPATPWFDKYLATLDAYEVRTVTTPDGRSHLSVILRPTSIVEAFIDARRMYAAPSPSISSARVSRAIEQLSAHES